MNKRGNIILAEVFFSDSNKGKIRPAIVLSNNKYNKTGFVLLAPITTAGDEFCLKIDEKHASCKLAGDSGARFDSIIRLHQKQIVKRIGKIDADFYDKLVGRIMGLIKK